MANKFYIISYKVNHSYDDKSHWIRMGSATQIDSGINCRIESTPINWDGTFCLFPDERAEKRFEKARATSSE